MVAPGALCIVGIVLVVAISVAALILRAAVNTYNKFAAKRGGVTPSPYMDMPGPSAHAPPPPPIASANPYQAPTSTQAAGPGAYGTEHESHLVPEPGFGLAIGIVIVRSIVTNIVGFIIGFIWGILVPQAAQAAVGQDGFATIRALWTTQLPLMVGNLLVSFLLGALILKAMLSTSYGKACLIHLIEYLVYLIIIGVIIGIAFAFAAGNFGA